MSSRIHKLNSDGNLPVETRRINRYRNIRAEYKDSSNLSNPNS